ncbi:S9 family peptidase [Flagellimonas oceanensis]|uniref:S9 family peptidase n=1 Tax=Flagellimonas oceanensis TaxID=2499163 RepID=UPI000F8F46B5|nr:DPP IV N-terminal domain-containing protein [Allomuricauda oceanensis]
MKSTNFIIHTCLAALCVSSSLLAQNKMPFETYERATKYLSKNMAPWVHDEIQYPSWGSNKTFSYALSAKEGPQYMKVNLSNGKKSTAFDPQEMASALSEALGKSMDPKNLPIRYFDFQDKNTIAFTLDGENYLYNTKNTVISEGETTPKRNRDEYVAPNGKIAAFIDGHNLWIRNLETNQKIQLTFDGEKDYGYATNNAGWTKGDNPVLKWSPNSDKIATFKQDARNVGEMYLTSTNVGHPELKAWKHPLPGDSIVFKLERVIIDLNTKEIIPLKKESDFQRSTITDHVAGRNGEFYDNDWKEDGSQLAFVSSSRDHKVAHLQVADAQNGEVRSVLKEVTKTYFESGARKINWNVLFDSNEVIWFSERDNWGHLYLYDLETGKLKNRITQGDWAVQQVLHVDEKNRKIYFTAAGKESGNPYYHYLYSVDFDGGHLKLLTPEKAAHRITLAPDNKTFLDQYSTVTTAPTWVLKKMNGKTLTTLGTADISELKANGWQEPVEFHVKARDNETDIYGILFLPSDYDETKSYPVLNYIYPGPQSGSVGNYGFLPARRDRQSLAELGFIVVGIDAMGTPGRSKSFHDAYYGNMGDNGLPDNITAIKQLAGKYPAMDTTRVGIWGHSGGGFASTDALLRYPDFYDVAVSTSGNHDNRNYEADWGEKWHGLLETYPDGTTSYDKQANQLLAENLKGKLLLGHGTMDDNVPPSNTLLVVEALIKANKDFDLILYPNKRHGYGDMTTYMTRKRWDYFVKNLKGMEPPKEFPLEKL